MKLTNPKRYKVAGLGEWGIEDGLVYENWEVRDFDVKKLVRDCGSGGVAGQNRLACSFGLDFGYTNDPTAFICMLIEPYKRYIYVFDEMYGYGMSNRDIYDKIRIMGYAKEKIFADSAEPKSIDELYSLGLRGIRKAKKGADSVNHGIQFIQSHKIIVLPKCVNFLREISSYSWSNNRFGAKTNTPAGGYDHLMDAMRYGLTEILGGERWGF